MAYNVKTLLQVVYRLGVLHGDLIAGNIVRNKENRYVMFIGFERASLLMRRQPLAPTSANQKRNRITLNSDKNQCKRCNCFELESWRIKGRL